MQKFFDRIELIPFHSCWEWVGSKFKSGYGRLKINGKTKRAHRLSYEIHNGPIENNLLVCHKCDNPACVNPTHLFLGTNLENTRDMLSKGRAKFIGRPKRKEKRPLTDVEKEIRSLYKGKYKGPRVRELATKYNLSETTIGRILKKI